MFYIWFQNQNEDKLKYEKKLSWKFLIKIYIFNFYDKFKNKEIETISFFLVFF